MWELKNSFGALAFAAIALTAFMGGTQAQEFTFSRVSNGLKWAWTDNLGFESHYS
jgi:hypothetical protein